MRKKHKERSGKICKKIGYLQVIKDDKEEKKEQNNKEQENLDLNNRLDFGIDSDIIVGRIIKFKPAYLY